MLEMVRPPLTQELGTDPASLRQAPCQGNCAKVASTKKEPNLLLRLAPLLVKTLSAAEPPKPKVPAVLAATANLK
mgnify:CR=1 FL=1